MSETRIGSGTAPRADMEEAKRRAELDSASRATAANSRVSRFSSAPILPPVSDETLREFVEKTRAPVPPAFADLSIYTDPLLDREIDAARARLGTRGGAEADGERFVLGRLEAELIRRHAPKPLDPSALRSLAETESAVNAERAFLASYRGAMTPGVRLDHERTLSALWMRREALLADEHACTNARPAVAQLTGGVLSTAFTADDLVATLKRSVPLPPQAEAQVRATFERWHRDTCRLTGEDPTIVVSRHRYAKAEVDLVPAQEAELKMRLEMLEASRTSVSAALAFLDSAARGESVSAAHTRVMGAHALSDVAMTVPAKPVRVETASPRAEIRDVEGLALKERDEARGIGHAQNTRFRGIDNSSFVRDADSVTYGPWRKNPGGPRTLEQAKAIFEKQTGQKLPPWVKLNLDPKVAEDRGAEYEFEKFADPKAAFERGTLVEDGVVVRVRPDVMESDEAIVGVLRHEWYELENLARLNEESVMTKRDVNTHTIQKVRGNLHDQAWDVADLEVRIMRERPGSAKHGELVALQTSLLARFALKNHGEQ